jgi:Protein of unknown function (DUF3618)
MGKAPDDIRQEIEETRARMGETVEAIGYKADVKSRAKDSITNKKDAIVGSVKDAKESLVGSIAGAKDSTASTIGDAAPSTSDLKAGMRKTAGIAQENPLGLAVGSFAFGFLAGVLIPSTRVEDEKIGPLADQIKDKAMETGQEALDRGKQVAQEAASVAKGSAQEAARKTMDTVTERGQEQGQQLASSAQDKAQDVASSINRSSSGESRPSTSSDPETSSSSAFKTSRPGP